MIVLPMKVWIAAGLLAASAAAVRGMDYRTVKGEVVVPSCTAEQVAPVAGESPAARAMRCARQGLPVAIQSDEALYLVEGDYTANRNAKLLDFVAKAVEAKGQVTEHDGTATINVAAMIVQK